MLKFATEEDAHKLSDFLKNGIIPTRIKSYILSYGFDKDFVKFWYSENENGVDIAVSLFEDALLVYTDENADLSEASAFINMLPFSTLSCEEKTADAFGFTVKEVKQGYVYSGDKTDFTAYDLDEDRIKEAYALISESIPGSFGSTKEEYFAFLSDFTYRKRRNKARGKCIIENDKLVSCAVTSAETETEALLSGVATDKTLRKGGYGKRTVLSLVNALLNESKKPYVIALNESAEGFYEHIGFKKDKRIAYVNRKDI